MREVKLPSGSVLGISVAPFADARALYQALLEEGLSLQLDVEAEMDANFFKDIFCKGFSSKKIESALTKCMERAVIDGLKVTNDSFEPEDKRQDYFTVLFEVAAENIRPFTKSLSVQLKPLIETIQGGLSLRQMNPNS